MDTDFLKIVLAGGEKDGFSGERVIGQLQVILIANFAIEVKIEVLWRLLLFCNNLCPRNVRGSQTEEFWMGK